jgi:hypothetical protein
MQSIRYSCPILVKLEFAGQFFRKNTQISNLMKICPVGAGILHADGQTDTTKLMVAFLEFAKTPKNPTYFHGYKPDVLTSNAAFQTRCPFRHTRTHTYVRQ